MRPEFEPVVARLRRSRSRPWLQVIDDANLDGPAEPEPQPATLVGPYVWLIRRVGEGLKLTQAGYLPPAVVTEAMAALGWEDDWIGKHNREDQTLPILELRESAQSFGLVRKYRGRLLATKAGRKLADDPIGLWWHVAEHLPAGRSEPIRQAGLLYLLTVAAGLPRDDALLAEGMTILGWSEAGSYQPLSPTAAFIAARDSWALFRRHKLLPDRRWDDPEPSPSSQAQRLARAALLGRISDETSSAVVRPAKSSQTKANSAVQLKITLKEIKPPIWRRIVVPASMTLAELHPVIQTAMGWDDAHLHMFRIGEVSYGDLDDIDVEIGDEEATTIGAVAGHVMRFEYEYDFGDGWDHDIRVEQKLSQVGPDTPRVIAGARACPPEDCGGPWGYQQLLDALGNPSHPEHGHMREWLGGDFDPEAFDLADVNSYLELYDRQTRQRRRG